MFGQNNPIYSQIPQASVPGVTPEMQMVAQQQAKPKGMFGGASIDLGRALAGYLAGIGNPAGVQALQAMNESRQRLLEHQQSLEDYNRKRTDDQADWRTQYDYELAHPKTEAGSEYERLLAAAGIAPGTPQYQQHVSAKVNQLENPMVMTPYGPMPYSAVNPQAPTAPVGKLTPIDGGQTPPASGGFPY